MKLKIPGSTLVKDGHSKAILQTDRKLVDEYNMKRQLFERQQAEINGLKAEMVEIKDLLKQLLEKK